MFVVEQDRMQWWQIVRVSGRASNRFAIRHALIPASNMRRHRNEMRHSRVVSMLHRLHSMWFSRVKTLIGNQLWVPGATPARSSQAITFRRVLNCRPSNVYFVGGNEGKLRPCNRHHFCPFCWARVAAFFYRRSKAYLNRARKTQDNLVLHCRVFTHEVQAPEALLQGIVDDATLCSSAVILKDIFDRYRELANQGHKQRQRKTIGSCWRLVVNPTERGWAIELRELVLAKSGRSLPWVYHRDGRVVYSESTKLDDDYKIQKQLGRFIEYPTGLLTEYPELAAAYLRASHGLRLSSGTGVFRACSSSLTRMFKAEIQHVEN